MKKILALVLVMAVSTMAVTFTGVDNGNGTVTISYDAPIVGMALDVDCTGGSATAVTLPAFFDVFMDYAYAQGSSYVYMSGNAIANQDAAGVATLPSASFCISAGGLEDNAGDVVPATGSITIAVDAATTKVTIGANTLRGGVVDYNGAMTTNLPIDINIQNIPSVCLGDADGDGWISPDDLGTIVGYIRNYEADGFWVEVSAGKEAYDYDQDGWISPDDLGAIVGVIRNYEADGFWVECAN